MSRLSKLERTLDSGYDRIESMLASDDPFVVSVGKEWDRVWRKKLREFERLADQVQRSPSLRSTR